MEDDNSRPILYAPKDMQRLRTWIQSIESARWPLPTVFATFVSLAVVRFLLDTFSSGLSQPFSFHNLPHGLLFFGSTFLTICVWLALLTRARTRSLVNVLSIGWIVTLIPPIVDLLATRGQGGAILSYIFDAPSNLWMRFISFFGGSLEHEFTLGLRLEVLCAMIGVGVLVYTTRDHTIPRWRALLKALVGVVGTYIIFFGYAVLPTVLAAVELGQWATVSRADVLGAVYSPRSFLGIRVDDPLFVSAMYLSPLYAVLITAQLALLWLREHRIRLGVRWILAAKDFFVQIVRPLRMAFQIMAIGAGTVLGLQLSGRTHWPDAAEWVLFAALCCVIGLSWIFSVLINDLADREIDRINRPNRPLVSGLYHPTTFWALALVCGSVALATAYVLSASAALLVAGMLGLSLVYSLPPLRLRRFLGVATITMALSVLLAMMFVFHLFVEGQSILSFPRVLIALIVPLLAIAFLVKDIRDRAGDLNARVATLPTLLGDRNGRIATGLLVGASLLITPIVLRNLGLLIVSVGCGVISYVLLTQTKRYESWVFVVYALFMGVALVAGV